MSLTQDQQVAIRDQWLSTYGGANAGRTAILQGGLKWQQITMNSDQSQFLETRRFQIEEICRAFRVMPIMVGSADKAATYASSEQMFLAHVVHTLSPWYSRIEQSANASLLTERERRAGLYTKFVAQGLMRADSRAHAEYISRMVLNGIMTRNEARGLLEMNPLDGLDDPLTPVNTDIGTVNANEAADMPLPQEPQE
jgi:HK97 family phage portal protein